MNAIAKLETMPVQTGDTSALMRIIERISERDDFSVDTIRELLEVKKANDAHEAMKAYVAAMADLKASEPLQVVKDKHVQFTTAKGVTAYDHATIGNVVAVALGALGRHGFSHKWEPLQKDGKITVRCVVTHRLGHSEFVELTASPDDSGGKNGIQAIVSTKTYLERHTLLAALGMATIDQSDDDGHGGGEAEDSEERKIEKAWVEQLGKSDTLDKYATTRQAIIDDYKGQSNVPETLRKAMVARKRELAPGVAQ